MSQVLIYGGTFDPVHHGHLITCRREILGADRVLLVPARISPHKTHLAGGGATGAQRVEMMRIAIEGDSGFAVDERELSREGPSYTVDTLESLAGEMQGVGLTLLIGADQLRQFHTWHRIERILELAEVAVMARPGVNLEAGVARVREARGTERVKTVMTPLVEISATDIRNRVKLGLPIDYLVPAGVARYIGEHRLYQA